VPYGVATIRGASSRSVTLAALSTPDPLGVGRLALWRDALPAAGTQGAMGATVDLAAGSAAGALHRRQAAGLAFSPAALVFGVGEGHQASEVFGKVDAGGTASSASLALGVKGLAVGVVGLPECSVGLPIVI
jgi:hypothetical protein